MYLFYHCICFYEPFTSLADTFNEPSYLLSFFVGILHYLSYCQFIFSTYLSFTRFILVFFNSSGSRILKRTFYPVILSLFIISMSPLWPVISSKAQFQRINSLYTNGHNLSILVNNKDNWIHDYSYNTNSFIYYSICFLSTIIFNLFSIYHLISNNCYKDSITYANVKEKYENKYMLAYSLILTLCQLFFIIYYWEWNISLQNTNDLSLFYILFKFSIFFVHFTFVINLYSFIILTKPLRNLMIECFKCKKEVELNRTIIASSFNARTI
ncbi:7TM GPCR, serpentine receptor class g (Srg) family-containing protein [Strongyloides ratti]|uniref:Serpentine receptor class gamma n=1 Tax=Strongyloides ratti TaxID=34506 RepID=A0A090LIM5_STRRB|nr:7TM GPCR, serpentine receptor class g (Srg) family-containing protein [Strongyloides ratti]CEF69662.1 7TM GPCR, serpentine receptor class g (Srg) family-containing protein [Strongyloides ratti]